MNRLRAKQIGAVLRLEIRKSFLSRRAWWIYLLAAVPFLIWTGHAFSSKYDGVRAASWKTEGSTPEKLRAIKPGMQVADVRALLPNPYFYNQWDSGLGNQETLGYSDGENVIIVRAADGKVENISHRGAHCDPGDDSQIFAGIFQFLYLRLFIFFGCLFVFMNLFRGEMLDKTLHFYFLAPLRREVLVAGKFLAGLIATSVIFGVSTIGQLLFLYLHWQPAQRAEYASMFGDSVAYAGVTVLGCLGYGAVFLMAGMVIRNPLIPGAVILLWEMINGILPSSLRHISIIYYLKSLCPVEIPMSRNAPPPLVLLASNVDPAGPAVAIAGLLLVAAGVLAYSMVRVRRMEISYGAD